MKLQSGQVLSGTLRLVKKIADGGMGSVWSAEHLVLGTEVAVKCLAEPFASVSGASARFVREARMTAKIESPHVVRVLDCRMNEGDEPYLVLELLRGENLFERVERGGPLSFLSELVEVLDQSCEALRATHGADIVHRDLKPENVFLVDCGNLFVKVLDFGVARPRRIEHCAEDDKVAAGTPQYMSPENMFDAAAIDERSDLFSLAAVAYFALTGRAPFDADSLEGLWFAVESGAFVRPSSLRDDVPVAVDRWFERALACEPTQRFQSAREMANALREAAFPEVAAASLPSIPPAPAVASIPRRRKGRKVALAIGALATALAFAWQNGSAADASQGAPGPVAGAPDASVDGKL